MSPHTIKKSMRRKIIILVSGFIVLILFIVGFRSFIGNKTNIQEEKAKEVLSTITLSRQFSKVEEKKLLSLLDMQLLTDRTKGLIYQKLAEITYMSGSEAAHIDYVGQAAYYLKSSKYPEDLALIYIQYANRLSANGNYSDAKQLLEDNDVFSQMNHCKSSLVRVEYYLSWADMIIHTGNDYEKADAMLSNVKELITQIEHKSLQKLYLAKYNILRARLAFDQGDLKEAKNIIKKYSSSENFGMLNDQMYLISDYLIPYLEIQLQIIIHERNFNSLGTYFAQYMNCCEEFHYYKTKLNMIDLVRYSTRNTPYEHYFNNLTISYYRDIAYLLTNQNTSVLYHDLSSMEDAMELKASELRKQKVICTLVILLAFVCMIAGAIFYYITFYMSIDSVTHLKNRRCYQHKINRCNRLKCGYCCIIFDIDDFKKVNDTLGHQVGDQVLGNVGAIVSSYQTSKVTGYRYGGEEICLILCGYALEDSYRIAEEIREQVSQLTQNYKMNITVSGGIAESIHGENVFLKADKNLYESKKLGKNRITK